ncbi:MAG TPA: hypothetical protein DEH25_07545 [Chloroflexi bacterium]|nr:hypothetical protein [Chloroflexota bacterium]HBY09157.1 hypothetical protein [Chloroflexota bacterium]
MSEIDEIFNYMEYISQQKRTISLVNSYRGVSFSLDVSLNEVTKRRGEIVVSTRTGQNISLLPATKILIHSDLFPKPIQATVASVDVHHRSAILKNLLYPQSMREGRKETRIQPKDNLKVNVSYRGKNEFVAGIFDISVEGISLLASDIPNFDKELVPKDSVRLKLRVPISGQIEEVELSFSGTVSYNNPHETPGAFRIGFMTFPSEQDKAVLRRYIFDRQTQLFNEVQDTTPKRGTTLVS